MRQNIWDFLRTAAGLASIKQGEFDFTRANRALWTNVLSIEQDNPLERNHQVRLMGDIYSGAKHVIAWLGYDFSAVRFLQTLRDDPMPMGATAFCSIAYWQRAWVT
jgi:hypothetical protein